jgi:hypothetical protein
LVTTTWYVTTDPGTAVDTFADFTSVSLGISTVTAAVHRPSLLPTGQLLPTAPDDSTVVSTRSPVITAATVTLNTTVTDAPTARSPDHVRFGLVEDTAPVLVQNVVTGVDLHHQ